MPGELELLGGDRLVVTKQATSPADREVLAHEASMLERAAHPGVVELVSFDNDGQVAVLRTEFAGEQTWHTAPPDNVAAIGQGIAALAETLADLHDLAVVHGAIDEDHIIVAPTGRLVLCDLRAAGDHHPSIDVAELGAVLERRLDTCQPNATDRRLTARLRDLAKLANQRPAQDSPDTAMTAREFATRAAAAVESARPTTKTPTPRPHYRQLAAVVMVALAGALLLFFGRSPGAAPIASLPAISQPANPAPPLPTEPTTAAPTPPTQLDRPPPTDSNSNVSTTSAESTSPQTSSAPPAPMVLEHDGLSYAVGAHDDVAIKGDWNCSGEVTAAVLRPGSGNLFLFTDWPALGTPHAVEPMVVPESTTDIAAAETCGHVLLVDEAGNRIDVPVTQR